MQLPGRLSQTTLGDLLGAVFRERITGTLELEEVAGPAAGRRHAIFLEDGLVVRIDPELGAERIDCDCAAVAPAGELRARLEALFALGDAWLHFRVPRPRDRRKDAPTPLRPSEFLPGRPRAREKLRASQGGPARTRRADPVRGQCLTVLQLPESAGTAEVREAFRRLASRYHPDRHPGASHEEKCEMLRKFAELSHAYHLLIA